MSQNQRPHKWSAPFWCPKTTTRRAAAKSPYHIYISQPKRFKRTTQDQALQQRQQQNVEVLLAAFTSTGCGAKMGKPQNGLPWVMEPRTKICGPIPGGLILTHSQLHAISLTPSKYLKPGCRSKCGKAKSDRPNLCSKPLEFCISSALSLSLSLHGVNAMVKPKC